MIRLNTVKRPALRAVAAIAVAAAGLLTLPVASASAALGNTPPAKTVAMGYSCIPDSSYGNSTPTEITADLTGPATAPAGSTVTLTLSVPPVALQPSVSAALPALSGIKVSGTSLVSGTATPGEHIPYAGESGPQAAGLAAIPAITATVHLTLDTAGTADVETPGEILITPVDATGKTLPSIYCSPPAVTLVLPITVTGATPTPTSTPRPPASGPVYTCTLAGVGTIKLTFPMSAAATGPGQVGATDRVTLSVSPPQVAADQLGRADAKGQTPPAIELKASLPVTGAQTGSVPVSGSNSVNAFTIKASGKLALTAAGTDKILLPPAFQVIGVAPGITVTLFSCKLDTTPDSVLLTLKVAGHAAPPAPAAAGATPVGAPDTGGGGSLSAAFSLPQAARGAAALLAGAGLTIAALRRRRKQHRTAA